MSSSAERTLRKTTSPSVTGTAFAKLPHIFRPTALKTYSSGKAWSRHDCAPRNNALLHLDSASCSLHGNTVVAALSVFAGSSAGYQCAPDTSVRPAAKRDLEHRGLTFAPCRLAQIGKHRRTVRQGARSVGALKKRFSFSSCAKTWRGGRRDSSEQRHVGPNNCL